MLLVFSGGLILYASLFTSPETNFLLSTPARADEPRAAAKAAVVTRAVASVAP